MPELTLKAQEIEANLSKCDKNLYKTERDHYQKEYVKLINRPTYENVN